MARIPFPEWYERIQPFMQKGGTFKVETTNDKYPLLSSLWYGFTPDDNKEICDIIESEGG